MAMQVPCRLLSLSFLWVVGACSQGTGILPAGPDTYTVTEHRAPILGGAAEAERAAMTEANDYCEHDGLKFFPLNMAEAPYVQAGGPGYSVTFRCLEPHDKELKRPRFQQPANLVIENRNAATPQ
jgi:hypothetical protein